MSERQHDVKVGAVLASKYRVERVLGQGGMGVVVEATQLDLERRVALKFLRQAALPQSSVALTRFEREARTVARLRGAHIVQIYDVGRLEHGEPFIVMELLEGEDLKAVLDREQRLPLQTAVDYVAQTCEAMAEAHAAGVVHRDLKPANLFVTRRADGRPLVKVLDFGISKLMSETTSLSLTSGALGSPLYMSPEQLSSSKDIDHRTDIWSLGTILYELLTGVPAFDGEGLPQVVSRIALGEVTPLSEVLPELPRGIENTIATCLQKRPLARYLTVADFVLALAPFARKTTQASIDACVRITQASSLRHSGLPETFDSMPPPAFSPSRPASNPATPQPSDPPGSRTDRDSALAMSPDITINISGAPPPNEQTQPEFGALVAPISAGTRPRGLGRVALWAGLGFVGALATLIAAQLKREPTETPTADAVASVSSAAVTAPSSPSADDLPLPPPTTTSPLTSATPEPSTTPPKRATTLKAPRPLRPTTRPAEPSADDMLKHR